MTDYLNKERYPDPTAYKALGNVEKEERMSRSRKIVYVCSPLSGDIEFNTQAARKYSRFVVDSGGIPITPHLLFPQFMDDSDPDERELAIFMDLILLNRCSELWVFGSRISSGMEKEIRKARQRKMKIRYFDPDFKEVVE